MGKSTGLKTRHYKGEDEDGDIKSPLQIQDAGLPDRKRRDPGRGNRDAKDAPHKPGERPFETQGKPALQGLVEPGLYLLPVVDVSQVLEKGKWRKSLHRWRPWQRGIHATGSECTKVNRRALGGRTNMAALSLGLNPGVHLCKLIVRSARVVTSQDRNAEDGSKP
jgi:hypothetical protein